MEGYLGQCVLRHPERGLDGAASLYHKVEGQDVRSKTKYGRTVVEGAGCEGGLEGGGDVCV